MKRPSKEDLLKKWTSILGPIGITGSQLENTDPSEFPSLLPTAMKVSAKKLALDLCFASEEEINEVKSRVQSENRDGKIEAVIEGGEFTEKKLEDDPEYKKLMKKGVTPLPAPSGTLFYLDFKYGDESSHKKQEELVKSIKENQMNKLNNYISPGVYVKEVDISTYHLPKKYSRIRKISKIFSK